MLQGTILQVMVRLSFPMQHGMGIILGKSERVGTTGYRKKLRNDGHEQQQENQAAAHDRSVGSDRRDARAVHGMHQRPSRMRMVCKRIPDRRSPWMGADTRISRAISRARDALDPPAFVARRAIWDKG